VVQAASRNSAVRTMSAARTDSATDASRSPHSTVGMSSFCLKPKILTFADPCSRHGRVPESSPRNVTPATASPSARIVIPHSIVKMK
jgi:hypothetical protein